MPKLLLLFILVPAVELYLLIHVGRLIGAPATLALIVVTGILGATLARYQGLGVLRRMQEEMARGELPGGTIVDGVIILLAAAVLITPGILTDIVGFLCLVPWTRTLIKARLRRSMERAMRQGRVRVWTTFDGLHGGGTEPGSPSSEIRDVEARPVEEPPEGAKEPR